MSANRAKAGPRRRRMMTAILLATLMMLGLSACRGFFGQAPIALLVPDTGGDQEVPVTVTFDISGSNDPDGVIISYTLDFGDGSTPATGTDVEDVITHTYTAAGTYTVILTVTDNDGRIAMANSVVTVGPVMITFATRRGPDYDIYRMMGDGTGQGAVRNSINDDLFPDLVRGVRDRIAFASEDGTSWNIWTMTTAGGSLNQLTTQTASNQIQPSWSRDGSSIVYASNALDGGSDESWELFTMTAAGGSQLQLTTQTPSWAIAPAYSPVNGNIVFVSDKTATGGSSIWLWQASSGTAFELYDSAGRDGDASPPLPGVLNTALDLPPGAGISRPAWSPDGSKIAFSRERTAGGIIDIYVMNADGTGAVPLQTYVDDLGVTSSDVTTDADEFCPYWLEDGSGICFVREVGGQFQIFKVAFATGTVTPLTSTGHNVSPTSTP